MEVAAERLVRNEVGIVKEATNTLFFSPLRKPGKPILRCEQREQWEIKLKGSVDCESQKGNNSLENLNSVMKWLERKREDE